MQDTEPHTRAAELARHISATLGPATAWSAVVRTVDGREHLVYPPEQDPIATHALLLDAAHGLACPGCERCQVHRPGAG